MGIDDNLRDLVVITDDRPGVLHHITQVLGQAGINIEGLSALTGQGRAVIHVLVTEHDRAVEVLETSGLAVRACRHTLVRNVPDRPDALTAVLAPLTHAGVNVEHAYLAVGARAHTRIVLVVDDPEIARACLDTRA